MEAGDTLVLGFDRALDPESVPSSVTVTEARSGSDGTLTITGLIQSTPIDKTYLSTGNGSATATGNVVLSTDHKTITVTLGPVTGSGNVATGTGSVTMTPAAGLHDIAGNIATGAATMTRLLTRLF